MEPASFARLWLLPSTVVGIASGALLAIACGSSSEQQTFSGPSAVRCAVRIGTETTAFPPSGGSGTVRVSANRECVWTATSDAPWVVLSASEGQGEGTVQFSVASNADPAARSTAVIINDQRVQIAQEGTPCEFTVSSNREAVDGAGGDRTVQVRSSAAQCSWTASANVFWITIVSGREGRGDGSVTFRVDAVNNLSRTGTLSIAGQTVHVDQGTGCTFSIGADTLSVDAAGGDRQVAVSAQPGCAWSAESMTAWITITSGSTGSGPGTVVFRVAATNGPTRTGTISVAGRTATIVQSGCSVSLSPAHLNMSASGGTATINVETPSGCPWSAATDAPWIVVAESASGSGRGQAQVAVTANVGPARAGSVIIARQTVGIAQASGCTYSLSPATQRIRASGGSAASSVSTASGCTWSATSSVNWIAIRTTSGSGPGQVTFDVTPNQGPPRTATLTIAGQVHSVTQESECTWSFSPPSHEVEAAGGFGTVLVLVTGACTWTAASDVDWIRVVAGASGAGGGLFQFSVAPNSGPARTGFILVAGEKYVVNQRGQ